MFEVETLLPPNARPLERAVEQAIAVDAPAMVEVVERVADPEACDESALAFHAWARSIDEWDKTWSVERKRDVVLGSVKQHRLKGTVQSVRDGLAAMGYGDVTIVEQSISARLDAGVSLSADANTALASGNVLHEMNHWAEYAVIISEPIRYSDAVQIRRRLSDIAPARCRLAQVVSNTLIDLDADYVLDAGWSLDATFNFEDA